MRCYTQNIDGLETREGLCTDLNRGKGNRARFSLKAMKGPRTAASVLAGGTSDGGCEVVQLHGDLQHLRCDLCRATCAWEEEFREALLLDGKAPVCRLCHTQDRERRDRGKRGMKIGSLRPNVVLYGEENPSADAIGAISTHDLTLVPDVLVILGTSLHVHGLKILVKEFAKAVHARAAAKRKVIFVNLTKPSESVWKGVIDYWIAMDCDQWVSSLRRHRPDIWPIQTPLELELKKTDHYSSKELTPNNEQGRRDDGKENRMKRLSSPSILIHEQTLAPALSRRPLEAVCNGSSEPLPTAASMISSTQNTAKPLQLPTPPPTGHRNRHQNTPSKRPRDKEEGVLRTPKRIKKGAVKIWQD